MHILAFNGSPRKSGTTSTLIKAVLQGAQSAGAETTEVSLHPIDMKGFAGCLTCCCGFILISLPYIGSVCLLPVSFTLRAFSLEFLAQWGPDYSAFPEEASSPGNVPPPPGAGIQSG